MPSIYSIFKDIKSLTDSKIEELFNNIGEIISLRAMTNSLYNDSRKQCFSKEVACLHCGGAKIIKHGKKNGVQLFRCNSYLMHYSSLIDMYDYSAAEKQCFF